VARDLKSIDQIQNVELDREIFGETYTWLAFAGKLCCELTKTSNRRSTNAPRSRP